MSPEPHGIPAISALIMVTAFFAIALGVIFEDRLEYEVRLWDTNRQTQTSINYRSQTTAIAYIGLTIFLGLFVGECLSVFQIGYLFAALIAIITVLPTAVLVWVQLGSMLELLVKGGSKAIDIDSYEAGQTKKIKTKK